MTLDALANTWVFVGGIASVTMISSVRHPRLQYWGFVVGLSNQWAWHYIAATSAQWGVLAVNIVYGVNYVRALWEWRHRE